MILDGCEMSFSLKDCSFKSMGKHVCMHAHNMCTHDYKQIFPSASMTALCYILYTLLKIIFDT